MNQDLDTRKAMLDLLSALGRTILALEGLADEAAQLALEIPDDSECEAWRAIVRSQRVKALELQGQYAALSIECTARYRSEP